MNVKVESARGKLAAALAIFNKRFVEHTAAWDAADAAINGNSRAAYEKAFKAAVKSDKAMDGLDRKVFDAGVELISALLEAGVERGAAESEVFTHIRVESKDQLILRTEAQCAISQLNS